ncbi:unnamed protein product [Prunus armeniaca]|uniref:Uncharacterized protein n=1 Tax=Prunus armeniaca TaxID=36596 RepID=A0A6J5XSJ4_PRUAR|nr:unnamed protein product [Prunus armeniaca]
MEGLIYHRGALWLLFCTPIVAVVNNVAAAGERELERLKAELRASNALELQLEMLTRIEGRLRTLNLN